MSARTDQKFKFQMVSRLEVERKLKSIKRSKATGLDDLPPGLLKDSAELIAAPLTHLINLSLMTNMFPADWKNAKVIPVHKSGTHSNLDNYRPISILPVLSKIIEKIVHRQLMSFLDRNDLLSQYQFGFRCGLSTELAATLLLDDIRREVDSGNLVGAVFIDLSKAFDTISHAKLLEKLSRYGINDGELEWFKDYLFSRKAIVSYKNCLSDVHEIYSGVPQGSILGPLLFLVFFNDITDVLKHSKIIKYADDTVLYVADKQTPSIQTKLDKDMDLIACWLKENELVINLKKGKTESLLFGTAKRRNMQSEPLDVSIPCPTRIPITSTCEYKYLGVYMDGSLSLSSQFEKCFKKASGRLRLLFKIRDHLDLPAAKAIYRAMIMPIFTYCGILQLNLGRTQLTRLSSFHDRSVSAVFKGEQASGHITSVVNANKLRACKMVRKCIDNDVCDLFKSYFTVQQHGRETRNNNNILKLPAIRTEYARRSFYFMGAKIYNDLPIELRKIENNQVFENKVTEHFNQI